MEALYPNTKLKTVRGVDKVKLTTIVAVRRQLLQIRTHNKLSNILKQKILINELLYNLWKPVASKTKSKV